MSTPSQSDKSTNRKTYESIRFRATLLAERHKAKSDQWLISRLEVSFPGVPYLILHRAMRKARRIARGEKPRTSGSPPNFCVVATPEELEFIRVEGKLVGSKAGVFHNAIRLYRSVRARPDWQARLQHAFAELDLF